MQSGLPFGSLLLCAALLLAPVARTADAIVGGAVGSSSAALWPVEIGRAKGFFAAHGISIDLVFAPSNAGVLQQLAAGSIDISMISGLVDPIRANNQGAAIAILLLEGQVPPYALMAKPTVKSIAELNGKTISVSGAKDVTRTFLDRILTANGLRPGEYDIVYAGATSARFAALQSGAVDAALLNPPFSFRAEDAGFTRLALAADCARDLPFSGTVLNRSWAAGNTARARGFLAAYTDSIHWFDDDKHREEAIKILAGTTHGDSKDIALSYDFFRKIDFFEPTGKVAKTQLAAIVKELQDLGGLNGAFESIAL
jgi:ABC-type nitrate/sulfonate/bicarbonate transport system substrate-binding protein